MTTNVVTISVDAKVAGKSLPVTGLSISLGVGCIPTIELRCAPSEASGKDWSNVNVKKPTLSDFADLYAELSKDAESMSAEGQLHIVINDGKKFGESLKMKEWILVGVGMTAAGATRAPYLSVTLQHPICNLTKVGAIYEMPKGTLEKKLDEATKSAKDPLSIMKAVYKCAREAEYWPVKGDNPDIPVEFRESLGVDLYDPEKYLYFNKSGKTGLFLAADAGKGTYRFAQAIGRMILPSSGSSSTWDFLKRAVGELYLSITQNQEYNFTTRQLVLEPTQPWKNASLSISEDMLASTEFPGMNPYRISGVMVNRLGAYSDVLDLGGVDNGNANADNALSLYMYSPVKNLDMASGRIEKIAAPTVLETAFRLDAMHGDRITSGGTDLSDLRADLFNKTITKYAKATYEIASGCMLQAKADLAFSFVDPDENIYLPGNTCRVGSKKRPIYYGYIDSIVHNLDCSGFNSTLIRMSRVRATEDFKIGGKTAIAAGATNAAYD